MIHSGIALGILAAATATAQGFGGGTTVGAVTSQRVAVTTFSSLAGPIGPLSRITGQPFSAQEETETIQTLSDGTRITQPRQKVTFFRDSLGPPEPSVRRLRRRDSRRHRPRRLLSILKIPSPVIDIRSIRIAMRPTGRRSLRYALPRDKWLRRHLRMPCRARQLRPPADFRLPAPMRPNHGPRSRTSSLARRPWRVYWPTA